MPGVENWTDKPLEVIQNLIDRLPSGSDEFTAIEEYFSRQLKSEQSLAWVPSLNSCPMHQIGADSLVRYRCMVQDMYDPELYLARYKVSNTKTGEVAVRSGRFKDVARCSGDESICMEDAATLTDDRHTLYCVPIPGEALWVKNQYAQQSIVPSTPSTSDPLPCRKRGRDEDATDDHGNSVAPAPPGANGAIGCNGEATGSNNGAIGGHIGAEPAGDAAPPMPDLNFPLPGEQGVSCLVKLYKEEGLKVNEVIEVVGILSVHPAMADFSADQDDDDMRMNAAEKAAHSPPPSLVPRLHAILVRRLQHNNPLLPQDLSAQHQAMDSIRSEASALRGEIMSVLEHALCGDRLAAEFLLCHLISSVYARADVLPLGKLSLNLSGPLAAKGLAALLHQLIAALVTQSHLLPVSLNNMNTLRLIPSKDYEANRLRSGQLQLSAGTHLVLDETALENGQLDVQGVQNVTALGNVIRWQKQTYDFKFHTQEFETDMVVLVLSEGESFLPKDVRIPLRPTQEPASLESHYAELSARLTDDLLNKFRVFVTLCRATTYSMNDDVQKALQEEFVSARKNNQASMTCDDFSMLLSLVRLNTLSHCQSECTPQILNHVLEMEQERRSRIPTPAAAPAQ